MSMYLGAKAAVENFTRVWAMELAADSVRVNAIVPGTIATDRGAIAFYNKIIKKMINQRRKTNDSTTYSNA